MTTLYSTNEKLGLLLYLLGDQAAELGLRNIDADRSASIRSFMQELREDPPSADEVGFVLDDFEKYFRFALNSVEGNVKAGYAKIKAKKRNPSMPEIISFDSLKAGSDPVADLSRLDPWQIASALASDQPKTIALVLSQLPANIAGRILEAMPEAVRATSFVHLSQPNGIPPQIVEMLLKTTFTRANQILERRTEVDHIGRVVELVRSLPKSLRTQLMLHLMDADAKFANAVRERMYRFDDILRLDDRGIQSVLARIASPLLIMALTKVEANISARVLGNLSKRARATVEEEMGFNEGAADSAIQAARAEIAQVLGQMDEAGEITL